MRLVFFVKEDCPACRNAKEKVGFFLDKWGVAGDVPVEAINLSTADGLVEAAMKQVSEVPTIVLVDGDDEVARWSKSAPPSDELKTRLGV